MEAGEERLQVNTAVCVWYTVRLRGWAVNLSDAERKTRFYKLLMLKDNRCLCVVLF